jgi:hypothetical protein
MLKYMGVQVTRANARRRVMMTHAVPRHAWLVTTPHSIEAEMEGPHYHVSGTWTIGHLACHIFKNFLAMVPL